MKKSLLTISALAVLIIAAVIFFWTGSVRHAPQSATFTATKRLSDTRPAASSLPTPVNISFVGPRENIPKDAPSAYGFWSFAQPVTGVLSRSGQPLMNEFTWLKQQGWKSVIDLRTDGERGEVGDDSKLPGFNDLGFHYLYLPLTDGAPPTEQQAQQFLAFVTNPANQPVHVHCRGGYGRTGTMTALYRYSVQGWPMDKAIEESRAFKGGVSSRQSQWLFEWAKTHQPGERSNMSPAP